jgi:hypothetical protein
MVAAAGVAEQSLRRLVVEVAAVELAARAEQVQPQLARADYPARPV